MTTPLSADKIAVADFLIKQRGLTWGDVSRIIHRRKQDVMSQVKVVHPELGNRKLVHKIQKIARAVMKSNDSSLTGRKGIIKVSDDEIEVVS